MTFCLFIGCFPCTQEGRNINVNRQELTRVFESRMSLSSESLSAWLCSLVLSDCMACFSRAVTTALLPWPACSVPPYTATAGAQAAEYTPEFNQNHLLISPQIPSSVCLHQRPPNQLSPVTQQSKRDLSSCLKAPAANSKAQPVHLWLSLLARSHSHLFGKVPRDTRDREREMCLKRNKITKQCLKKTKVNSRVSENASFTLASPENLEEGKISVIYYSKYPHLLW